jgi:hypothetical protein
MLDYFVVNAFVHPYCLHRALSLLATMDAHAQVFWGFILVVVGKFRGLHLLFVHIWSTGTLKINVRHPVLSSWMPCHITAPVATWKAGERE